jgi:methylenetetrahydrofolate--tRNA-(uracil-5-)-methyltransferase
MAAMDKRPWVTVVGGGLAGSEAAWQAAERGLRVRLYEMRPEKETGAHQTQNLAELVCSNSLGSALPDRASGILMHELDQLGSLLLRQARQTAVPAGGALAVDRTAFSQSVTEQLQSHPGIELIRAEVDEIPEGPTVLASGPLTSPALSDALRELSGEDHLYFYDALSPIVEADSIDMTIAFRASRYGRGQGQDGDYINCPLDEETYTAFVRALLEAESIPLREFEAEIQSGVKAGMDAFFEGCLPIEIIASRGEKSLAFGPMRPVGLEDPKTGRRPHAVVQLRQDNLAGNLYNLVGFQTNLRYSEQRRVFRMIPGLAEARFARYGQMHRNTFVNAPRLLDPSLAWRGRPSLYLAGQITGVEGYLGNIATGLLAGLNISLAARGEPPLILPKETMLGALCHYVTHADVGQFQPMKANLGLLPILEPGKKKRGRRERARAHAERARRTLDATLARHASQLRIATVT